MFIEASVQDRNSGGNLVGRIIQIYWDGDNVYYMGRVTEVSCYVTYNLILCTMIY